MPKLAFFVTLMLAVTSGNWDESSPHLSRNGVGQSRIVKNLKRIEKAWFSLS